MRQQEDEQRPGVAVVERSKPTLIRLNGEERQVRAGMSVAALLAELGLPGDRVAVEVDREIVRRDDWEGRQLTPGVVVEVVHFVGGG